MVFRLLLRTFAPMHDKTVVLSRLSIGYKTRQGVRVVGRDLSASILSGELTCLLGENGVGKSTLLRTLAGFQPKLSGDITIQGRRLEEFTPRDLAKMIGVVLTEKPDVGQMTAAELVGMGRSPYTGFWGTMDDEDRQIVDQAFGLVGIESLKKRLVTTLSDGERQKVMIAKALAQQTPVIYLDEPTAFLDYPSKVEMLLLLQRLSREADKTIFLSTHDVELALQVADCLWLMDGHDGLHVGTQQQLAADGSLSRFIERGEGIHFDTKTLTIKVVSK